MSDNYDRIARFYDVDMARNMPFDDVGFYAGLCERHPRRVLELGCGTGRILLELLARGIDIVGIDRSAGMLGELQRKAASRGLEAPVARMDLRRLALHGGFDVVLCPYSLVTYLTGEGDVASLLASVQALLNPGGILAIDAFVPRSIARSAEFALDYRRAFGDATLVRWKRIVPLGATNRVERHYKVVAADGTLLDQVDVAEEIRPYTPQALREAVVAAGFDVEQAWWNYAATAVEAGAQFFTLAARRAALD